MIKRIIYEWLISEFKVGTSYTNEHLEILSEALKVRFGDNWAITSKKVGEILNQTYNIQTKQYKKNSKVPPVEISFYKNINPTGGTFNKKTNINIIKSRIEILDIKKELDATSSDFSLENSIQKRKTKILSQLDEDLKEILLEGIF